MPMISMVLLEMIKLCDLMDDNRKAMYIENVTKAKTTTYSSFRMKIWRSICDESIKLGMPIKFK